MIWAFVQQAAEAAPDWTTIGLFSGQVITLLVAILAPRIRRPADDESRVKALLEFTSTEAENARKDREIWRKAYLELEKSSDNKNRRLVADMKAREQVYDRRERFWRSQQAFIADLVGRGILPRLEDVLRSPDDEPDESTFRPSDVAGWQPKTYAPKEDA